MVGMVIYVVKALGRRRSIEALERRLRFLFVFLLEGYGAI